MTTSSMNILLVLTKQNRRTENISILQYGYKFMTTSLINILLVLTMINITLSRISMRKYDYKFMTIH